MANAYTYDVYGEPRSASGAQDNEYQFTGQQVDGRTAPAQRSPNRGWRRKRRRRRDPASGGR